MVITNVYIDDMSISGKDTADPPRSFDLLKTNCDILELTLNTSKSKTVVFRKRGPSKKNEKWYFNGVPLEIVNKFDYLSTVFNFNCSFSSNSEIFADKGIKAMHCLLANTRKFNLKLSTIVQFFMLL